MLKIILIIYLLFSCTFSYGSYESALKSTCRITKFNNASSPEDLKQSVGTGVVIGESLKKLFILTCGHVVLDGEVIVCQFYNSGRQSKMIQATIIKAEFKAGTHIDAAILSINKSDLESYPIPPITPLKNVYTNNIISAGCPQGSWPSLFIGTMTERWKETIKIEPGLVPGRSGSGIFNSDGTFVIGIGCTSDGMCTSAEEIERILEGCLIFKDEDPEVAPVPPEIKENNDK